MTKHKHKHDDIYYEEAPLASIGTRFAAIAIDSILLGIVAGILFAGLQETSLIFDILVTAAYQWFFLTSWDGQTPGKRLMGIRVVKLDGSRVTGTDALIRAVGYFVNTMAMMIGWLWAFINPDNRGWHDLFAGTVVIKD